MKFWKFFLFASVLALSTPTHAQDSAMPDPTWTWSAFNQVSYALENEYDGPYPVDLPGLLEKARKGLEATCAQPENCTLDAAYTALEGVIKQIGDPHTYLRRPGSSGLGAEYEMNNAPRMGWYVQPVPNSTTELIQDVYPFSASARAGLKPGDVVTTVNGKPASDFDWKANDGAAVQIGVARQGQVRSVKVQPAALEPRSLLPYLQIREGVGYLRIPSFWVGEPGEVTKEVHRLLERANAQRLLRLIVDLRNNDGGYDCFESALGFVDRIEYLERNRTQDRLLVYTHQGLRTESRQPGEQKIDRTRQVSIAFPLTRFIGKVVVLVDQETASCGELFALFLQQNRRALVLGQPTFGIANGAITSYELPGGAYFQLTVLSAYTASGTLLPYRAVPDLELKMDPETFARTGRDPVLERAIEEIKKP